MCIGEVDSNRNEANGERQKGGERERIAHDWEWEYDKNGGEGVEEGDNCGEE